jgi:Tol biopolymer transport system component
MDQKRIGHYEIVERIGAGGMGEVYRARDTRLGREVALKLLPDEFAADAERLERFEQEARTVAALDHPGIVTVHAIEEFDGKRVIAMQLVEGRTLDGVIPAGGMTLERIFDVAIPLADAIAAAHDAGVTHRDIKPGNIMVGDDDRVRVLDFGLSKVLGAGPSTDAATEVVSRHITAEGTILGTVAYMAPEQAEGKAVDARSDIFALGVVLYQMATGELPFTGDTGISVISSILRDDPPPVNRHNARLPHHLARIIRRCLQKNPEKRYQTAKDLRNDLETLKAEFDSGELQMSEAVDALPRPERSGISRGLAAVGAVVFILFGIGIGFLLFGRGAAPEIMTASKPKATWSLQPLTMEAGAETQPRLTAAGDWVVYTARDGGDWDIFLRGVGGDNPINLTANSGDDDTAPAISPDGRQIAFRSERQGGGIFVMGRTGESVRKLSDTGNNPDWSPDGATLAVADAFILETAYSRQALSGIHLLDVESGEMRTLFEADGVQPRWSPNGQRIAFWGLNPGSGQRDIWSIGVAGGDTVRVTSDAATDWNPTWSPDGRYLYFASDRSGRMAIWRMPIDQQSGEALGPLEPVTTGGTAWNVYPTFSADGSRMAYSEAITHYHIYRFPVDPTTLAVTGDPEQITSGSRNTIHPDVSPDGEWIAFTLGVGQQEDVYIMRLDGSELTRLTNDPAKDRRPVWSPDGERIAFYSDRSGTYEAWAVNRDGSGLVALTNTSGAGVSSPDWSPDGRHLLTTSIVGEPGIFQVSADAVGATPDTLPLPENVPSNVYTAGASWSPDGNRIAIGYREGPAVKLGILEVTTDTFTFHPVPGPSGAVMVVWYADSRHMVFAQDGDLYMVDLDTGESRRLADPDEGNVFQFGSVSDDGRWVYVTLERTEVDIWMMERE